MGLDAGNGIFHCALDAIVGGDDQRSDDPVRRMGQAAHRPRFANDGAVDRLLWDVDI